MNLLITGCAGFIGFHLAQKHLLKGDTVIGIDNINAYYEPALKHERLKILKKYENFIFYKIDIAHTDKVNQVFKLHAFSHVINLAAQAGVRYSLENPHAYIEANINGFLNILEASRTHEIEHLIYASSSSVYGGNSCLPYKETDDTDKPLAIYAATKKSNELMAHAYSHLYKLKTTGLRFFTVYGPWGRPDMAFFSFTKNILSDTPIKIFNFGKMQRDFTFIDDIINGISLVIGNQTQNNEIYNIYNIGSGRPVNLLDYVGALEEALGKKAIKEFAPMQKGDVLATHADTTKLHMDFDYTPSISIKDGVSKFAGWYQDFYASKLETKIHF